MQPRDSSLLRLPRQALALAALIAAIPVLVNLACENAKETRCLLFPESLDFGAVLIGEFAEKTLRIENDGETELDLVLSLTDVDFMFPAGDTIQVRLAPGDTVAVGVRFVPQAVGPREAMVEIRGGPCREVACRGRGESRECRVEPDRLDFGRVRIGEARDLGFMVRNGGTLALSGEIGSPCPEFKVLEGAGRFTIAPGESLRVTVAFAPDEAGTRVCGVSLGTELCSAVECGGEGTRTWEVRVDGSGHAPTIQAAIDSSRHGDLVLVHPGTYYENLNLRGKAINLKSAEGPERTIIDGSREDNTVILCGSGETNDTIIEGFTIRGGRGWSRPWDPYTRGGGGIQCLSSTPTIRSNMIRDNRVEDIPPGGSSRGGGISFGGAGIEKLPAIRIEANVIENNFASANGGGINIGGPCVIRDNVIRGNSTGRGDGAGVYVLFPAWPVVIRRNLIEENHAGDHGGGIYIGNWRDDINPEVSHNLILRNTSTTRIATDCSGGGIWLSGKAHVHHNTIAFNSATNISYIPAAGGCCLDLGPVPALLEHNIFFRNAGGGIVAGPSTVGVARVNIIFESEPNTYNHPGNGFRFEDVIEEDPLFCDTTATSMGGLAVESPALSWPEGPIGAVDRPTCSIPMTGLEQRRKRFPRP